MTITVTVTEKNTATSRPENNDLKRRKQRARTTERMCTRRKQDAHRTERECTYPAIEGKKWAEKLKKARKRSCQAAVSEPLDPFYKIIELF